MLLNSQEIPALSHYVELRFDLRRRSKIVTLVLNLILSGLAPGQSRNVKTIQPLPVEFVRMFSADADVHGSHTPCQHLRDLAKPTAPAVDTTERPAACDQVLNILAGKPDPSDEKAAVPIQAAKIAVDARGRVLITEPAKRMVHVLDFENRRYTRINGARDDRMAYPYAVAADAANRIYVTDLERGRIAVYDANGKFVKYIGRFKREGLFDRPHSIAIDRATGRIFLADTARGFVLILDLDGKILAQIGKRGGGDGPGEFRKPSEIALYEQNVFVFDQQTSRIQVLDFDGHFQRQFALAASGLIEVRGIAFDAQGRLLVSTAYMVKGFDQEGKFLFDFGMNGTRPGDFNTTGGICTDEKNRAYAIDVGNSRIQVFQMSGEAKSKTEASQ